MSDRFERQRALFGDEGQGRISNCQVAVIGAGGLGCFVAMELAYLGVGRIAIVDPDCLERSNRNRLVGGWDSHEDGEAKVSIAHQLVERIDPNIEVDAITAKFPDPVALEAIKNADYVMGCVDRDGVRLELNEFICREDLRLVDAASDTLPDGDVLAYGGRVCCVFPETGCLVCLQVLDPASIQAEFASPEQQADWKAIYGVERSDLGESGPSVVSVNGVVASLAVTEFMVAVTGLRAPFAKLEYLAHRGVVLRSLDSGDPQCYFCSMRLLGRIDEKNGRITSVET